jgi:hypothetical protein
MYFSRRKLAMPLPPLPAKTSILDSSMNFILNFPVAESYIARYSNPTNENSPIAKIGLFIPKRRLLSSDDGNCSALLRTLDGEYNLAGDLGKQRVVFAHADVVASVKLGATLTNDDAARAD